MKLILKFNLALILIFLGGLAASYYYSDTLLQRNARAEIQGNARIMMESALAVRAYTNTQIKPLLSTQMRYQFLPQSVPSYSAVEYFSNLRKKFPEYNYKEATINPTNPRDKAEGWEVDVVEHFRENADAKEVIGERDTVDGKALYLARPLRIVDPACLSCHSTVEAAPQTLIDKYGPNNGFNWRLNDVVAAQIVTVPYALPLQRAGEVLHGFVVLLVSLFAFLFLVVNTLLYTLVVRPIRRLATIAGQVRDSPADSPEFPAKGKDEVSDLGRSLNLLRRSLIEAMNMLQE